MSGAVPPGAVALPTGVASPAGAGHSQCDQQSHPDDIPKVKAGEGAGLHAAGPPGITGDVPMEVDQSLRP